MENNTFKLKAPFSPSGDQPKAIEKLSQGVLAGKRHQVLLGVTGSGKTFTMANIINRCGKPTLVIAPNKTLAAQLFGELKALFPENAVEYFVSYYDYYQPEAYIPQSDTYIEKDASINEFIDRLRHSATRAVLTRRDVIIVASVSCIYGLGSPEEYEEMNLFLKKGDIRSREEIIDHLVSMLYERVDHDLRRGSFRVRGDIIDIFPSHEENRVVRVELFGDEIEEIFIIDPVTGKRTGAIQSVLIYPTSHYVTTRDRLKRAIKTIKAELEERLRELRNEKKLVEAQRLEERTNLDLEMLEELGYCPGIENYSRHLSGRKPGDPPPTLLDYFPKDFLVFIDESHITVPQIRGMFRGDRSRKQTLVDYGFRLPSALDNRPLTFEEFESMVPQVIYVSATPGPYELQQARGEVVEQIIRPTGLLDPEMVVRPATNQVDDLIGEIQKRLKKNHRVLVTTLTKRMAEELTDYLNDLGIKAKYLHSDISTIERSKIIQGLRRGDFHVLVGINLLREGLDMPEVSLVAVLDADKEGFLRSERSLIQTAGRAARNSEGLVILYGDTITESMKKALEETKRRRAIQEQYNLDHGLVPKTIMKSPKEALAALYETEEQITSETLGEKDTLYHGTDLSEGDLKKLLKKIEREMKEAAKQLDFERAAILRDQFLELRVRLESKK
ncbi:Excinuclease ABC subunit B [Dissulfuribacter thermophilus]|uniref:UvrABC system protein B n=1 Tax=Dissulfuribacter thermophilus TaxID=1156395 RepID=A0A1B9F790_9BACT|nr:Excinuclease ABC subunit B [Dissulfuribacter thermophilus]